MQHGIEMSVLFDEKRARARVHRCSTIETKVEGGGSRRRRVYEESRPHEWTFHSCVPLTPSYNPRRTVYGILSTTNDTTMRHTHNTHTYKRWDIKMKREKEREREGGKECTCAQNEAPRHVTAIVDRKEEPAAPTSRVIPGFFARIRTLIAYSFSRLSKWYPREV